MNESDREAIDREPPRREYAAMSLQPLWWLLLRIRLGRIGHFRQIWKVVAAKARPADANDALLRFLESSADSLDRYWCAHALIAINHLDRHGWQPTDLSAPRHQDAVARVRTFLERQARGISPNEPPVPDAKTR